MVYFCYAWFAGNEQAELFGEDIQAWQYGPVVRELYLEFRNCGSGPIESPAWTLDWNNGNFVAPSLDADLTNELTPIWDAYKDKSAAWLVAATHTPDEPWATVVTKLGSESRHKIPFELIKKVYSERVARISA